jgi:hypothetical protein
MRVAIVLCGALAKEIVEIVRQHDWDVSLHGIAAQEHMTPQNIAPLVEKKLRELMPQFERVIVAYGDCGTAGALDEVLARYDVPRISGPHCYEMYAGTGFQQMMDDEPGTFFLTDFLLRSFDGLVWKGLGLDRFPQLKDMYFANYQRVVYLQQRADDNLIPKAQAVAEKMGFPLEVRRTGYGELERRLVELIESPSTSRST